jgi:hypothetical protein
MMAKNGLEVKDGADSDLGRTNNYQLCWRIEVQQYETNRAKAPDYA